MYHPEFNVNIDEVFSGPEWLEKIFLTDIWLFTIG
jgi:hypothetical protein